MAALAAVFVAVLVGMIAVEGRRCSWSMSAGYVACYVAFVLTGSWTAAFPAVVVAHVAVRLLPFWADDPPSNFAWFAVRRLVPPWRARRAWETVARTVDPGQICFSFIRSGSWDGDDGDLAAVLPTVELPIWFEVEGDAEYAIKVLSVVRGRIGVLLVGEAEWLPPRGRRKRRRWRRDRPVDLVPDGARA